jgi:hypothetical protein
MVSLQYFMPRWVTFLGYMSIVAEERVLILTRLFRCGFIFSWAGADTLFENDCEDWASLKMGLNFGPSTCINVFNRQVMKNDDYQARKRCAQALSFKLYRDSICSVPFIPLQVRRVSIYMTPFRSNAEARARFFLTVVFILLMPYQDFFLSSPSYWSHCPYPCIRTDSRKTGLHYLVDVVMSCP